MPNSRRRRFSVRNGIAGRETCKIQNNLQPSTPEPEPEIKTMSQNIIIITAKSSKTKNKSFPNASKNTSNINMLPQSSSVSVSPMMKMCSNITVDKDVTASSSNIDLFNLIHSSDDLAELSADTTETCESAPKRLTRQLARETTPIWRDKHPRQHRIKVRSPKRRTIVIDSQNKINEKSMDMKVNLKNHDTNEKKIVDKIIISKDNKSSHCNYIDDKIVVNIATEPIDWKREVEVCATNLMIEAEEDERQSDHSLEDMCRICHGGDSLCQELGQLISACSCRGTVGRVHVKCLERWLTESGKSRCELCGTRYMTRRVHRYGVPRALVMWVLSQNAKQLMVDSLGIMLMSPLAVLAAWLSGRTLAGLMTQDAHATPWPLASTFVLACMTLVCYYCWIVSAATRHALGWWIWYRSQYEVRLQLQNGEE